MAATATTYNNGAKHFALGDINWPSSTIVALLLDNSYTIDLTDEFISDLSSHEISSGGYVRKTIGSKTNALTSNVYTLSSSAGTVSWTSLTATNVRFLILAKSTGTDSSSPLLQVVDFGQNYSPSAEDLTYQIPSTGFIQVTAV